MSYKPRHRFVAVGLTSVLAVVLAACGSDKGSSGSTSASTTNAAVSTTGAASTTAGSTASTTGAASTTPGATTPSAPTGTPVLIYTTLPLGQFLAEPGVPAIMQARIDRLNAEGGIGGHPVKLKACNNNFDPNATDKCARDAIADGAVAMVAMYDAFGATAPILEKAGIPVIAPIVSVPTDNALTNLFPIDGLLDTWFGGLAGAADEAGCKSVGLVGAEFAAVTAFQDIFEAAWNKLGHKVEGRYVLATTVADPSAVVQAATANTDCLMLNLGADAMVGMVTRMKQVGATQRLLAGAGTISQQLITDSGGANSPLEGMIFGGPFPALDNPAFAKMLTDISTYASGNKDIRPERSSEKMGWLGVDAFAQVASTIKGDVTAATVLAALKTGSVDLHGARPKIDFSAPAPIPTLPRAVSPDVWFLQVKGGKIVDLSTQFVDVSKLLTP